MFVHVCYKQTLKTVNQRDNSLWLNFSPGYYPGLTNEVNKEMFPRSRDKECNGDNGVPVLLVLSGLIPFIYFSNRMLKLKGRLGRHRRRPQCLLGFNGPFTSGNGLGRSRPRNTLFFLVKVASNLFLGNTTNETIKTPSSPLPCSIGKSEVR